MSLSVIPARKRLDLVGKMWCIILNWKAINFESLVIRKGNVYTLWMLSVEKPQFRILFSDVGGLTLFVRSEAHLGASCFDLIYFSIL